MGAHQTKCLSPWKTLGACPMDLRSTVHATSCGRQRRGKNGDRNRKRKGAKMGRLSRRTECKEEGWMVRRDLAVLF